MNFKHKGRALGLLRHIEQESGIDFAESMGFSHTMVRAVESGQIHVTDRYWQAYRRRTGLSQSQVEAFVEAANTLTAKQLTRRMVLAFLDWYLTFNQETKA